MRIFIIIIVFVILGSFVYPQAPNFLLDKTGINWFRIPEKPFHLGLDLLGGAHLVYQADLSEIDQKNWNDSMNGVRDVIERRVNAFGVSEPVVQVSGKDRLIVELPQVKDVSKAIEMIGKTPFLEFRELKEFNPEKTDFSPDDFVPTGLTGKDLKQAFLSFDQTTGLPQVSLIFNDQGRELLAKITKKNLNKPLAIFIDGIPISVPNVQNEITNGQAVITGNFTIKQARELARNLSAGALPVPIKLISQQVIGPSLGKESLNKSLKAGLYGLIALAIFLLAYYRLYGLIAIFALLIYVVIVLAVFKFIPVTLTLAGIAGFILSLGMAVDGNILIFSRIKEELKQGKTKVAAVESGFKRAWFSIRDSQFTTLIAAVILYIFTTSLVKGFALTLAIGIIISIFTAVYVTHTFLKTLK